MSVIIWKDIPGYEGLYRVSECGQVKRLQVFRSCPRRSYLAKEKILISVNHSGYYLTVSLRKDSYQRFYPIHRLVATAFIPNPDKKPHVNHKDRNKQNNHVNNLEWCTPKENSQHWADCESAYADSLTIGSDVLIERLNFTATIIDKIGKEIRVDKLPPQETYDWFYYKELQLIQK